MTDSKPLDTAQAREILARHRAARASAERTLSACVAELDAEAAAAPTRQQRRAVLARKRRVEAQFRRDAERAERVFAPVRRCCEALAGPAHRPEGAPGGGDARG